MGDGRQWGLRLSYAEQPRPEGLAQAFIIGAEFIGSDSVMMVLGDNIFYGHGFQDLLSSAASRTAGATVFAHMVRAPQRYGVVAFDKNGRTTSIEEKSEQPKSNWAVTGLYAYDNDVVRISREVKPSKRGELEITSVNNAYLENGQLQIEKMGHGYAWFDTGTPQSMLAAANYVATLEERQGLKIASPEEIAFRKGFITPADLEKLISERYANNDYGKYLTGILTDQL